ncbi:hypothetical protein ACOSQ4_028631 [Xanthoceras sorbifolium]
MSFVLQPGELVLCLVFFFFFLPVFCIYSRLFAYGTCSNPFLFEEEKMTLDALAALVPQVPRRLAAYKRVSEKLLVEFKLVPDSSGASQRLAEHGTVAADQRTLGSESSISIQHHDEGVEFRLVMRWDFNNKKFYFSTAVSLSFPLSSIVQLSPLVIESALANHSDLDSGMLQGDLGSCDICHGCFLNSFFFF